MIPHETQQELATIFFDLTNQLDTVKTALLEDIDNAERLKLATILYHLEEAKKTLNALN